MTDAETLRATFRAMVLTAFVDGRPELSEARVVAELAQLDPRLDALGDAFELSVQARLLLDEHGVEDALEKIVAPITDPGDRDLAFRMCARVMFADGKTDGEEAMVLGTLQELFGMPHVHVLSVLEEERARRAAQ